MRSSTILQLRIDGTACLPNTHIAECNFNFCVLHYILRPIQVTERASSLFTYRIHTQVPDSVTFWAKLVIVDSTDRLVPLR